MRLHTLFLLLMISCFSAEALKKRQLPQTHTGYCPVHMMACNIYCPPNLSIDQLAPRPINGCTRDTECALDEKCCKPACGCINRCTKALEKLTLPF